MWRSTLKNRTMLERDGSGRLHSLCRDMVGADCGVRRHLPMRARRSKASQIRYATGEPNLSSAIAGDNTLGISVPWARPAPRTLHTRGACPSLIGSSIAHPRPPSHRAAARDQRRDDYILITRGCSRPPLAKSSHRKCTGAHRSGGRLWPRLRERTPNCNCRFPAKMVITYRKQPSG